MDREQHCGREKKGKSVERGQKVKVERSKKVRNRNNQLAGSQQVCFFSPEHHPALYFFLKPHLRYGVRKGVDQCCVGIKVQSCYSNRLACSVSRETEMSQLKRSNRKRVRKRKREKQESIGKSEDTERRDRCVAPYLCTKAYYIIDSASVKLY